MIVKWKVNRKYCLIAVWVKNFFLFHETDEDLDELEQLSELAQLGIVVGRAIGEHVNNDVKVVIRDAGFVIWCNSDHIDCAMCEGLGYLEYCSDGDDCLMCNSKAPFFIEGEVNHFNGSCPQCGGNAFPFSEPTPEWVTISNTIFSMVKDSGK